MGRRETLGFSVYDRVRGFKTVPDHLTLRDQNSIENCYVGVKSDSFPDEEGKSFT